VAARGTRAAAGDAGGRIRPQHVTRRLGKLRLAWAQPQEIHASESWKIFGHDLKITDTLLVAFTALLFLATAALWWSTRRLVKSAKRSAERQLRAYVTLEGGHIQIINNGAAVEVGVTFKNSGQTPGYQFNVDQFRNPSAGSSAFHPGSAC